MRKNRNLRYRYVKDMEDMQKIINIAESMTSISYYNADKRLSNLRNESFIEDKQRYLTLTTRYVIDEENANGDTVYKFDKNYCCTWIFDKTGQDNFHMHPSRVARLSGNVYKPFDIINSDFNEFTMENGKPLESAKPILGFNPKYDGTEHYVYCYDLNSAYAMVLQDKIIDTWHPHYYESVKANQVGFNKDTDITMVTQIGCYADVVFDLIDSPYKEFVTKWYNIKKKAAKGSLEKAEAKDCLVITVGLFQLHNPYLRAYVVNSCNNYIKNIIKKHKDVICMWNTDAVYSTVPLEDELNIGDNIGQFKLEYEGTFRQLGNNYQKVNAGETSYRGICKIQFSKDWNILKDELPKGYLPYTFDKNTNKIIKHLEVQ